MLVSPGSLSTLSGCPCERATLLVTSTEYIFCLTTPMVKMMSSSLSLCSTVLPPLSPDSAREMPHAFSLHPGCIVRQESLPTCSATRQIRRERMQLEVAEMSIVQPCGEGTVGPSVV